MGKVLLSSTILLFVIVGIAGCPLSTFYVVYPNAYERGSAQWQLIDNQIVITVQFSEAVDLSSITPSNLKVLTNTMTSPKLDVQQGDKPTEIVVRVLEPPSDILSFEPDGEFCLMMTGSGDQPIRDLSGENLDGDADDIPGGPFWTWFVYLG